VKAFETTKAEFHALIPSISVQNTCELSMLRATRKEKDDPCQLKVGVKHRHPHR